MQSRHGKKSIKRQAAGTDGLALSKPEDARRRGRNKRLFAETVLWIMRTGSPRRDLPEEFGQCNIVFKRLGDWVKAGIWQKLFDAASGQPDMEYAMADATIVKVHRHGQGAGIKVRP
nr:transposase [uncultured Ottowia sp.]